MKILVAYASAHGSTREVAHFIGRVLYTYGAEVTVANAADVQSVEGYDVYVLGSAIHGGLWLQEIFTLFDRFEKQLAEKPMYFWVTCIRALENDGREHALKYYFDPKTLDAFDVRGKAVFTGQLDTKTITRQEQWYLVANYDGKLDAGDIRQDYRDWQAIAAWTNDLAKNIGLVPEFDTVPGGTLATD